jgi:hypothetical protein
MLELAIPCDNELFAKGLRLLEQVLIKKEIGLAMFTVRF